MSHIATLEKIRHVREHEKRSAKQAHHQSIKAFEEVATKLYNLLKKKENAKEAYDLSLQSKTTVQHLKEQSLYIDKLNDQIIHLQEQVNIAREKMEQKRENLTDAHIEVKKFEKMIEQQHERLKESALKRENEMMDDISIKQHLNRKNR